MIQIQPTDTCSRCGLRRVTRALEEKGITIRLCDDCYWGQEVNATAAGEHAASSRPNPRPATTTAERCRRGRARLDSR